MDVSEKPIRIRPGADKYLFQNFQSLRLIFSDVLGQAETDYLSIALINHHNELFFLSSIPSIEQNLIEKHLWHDDNSYKADFISKNKPALWSEITRQEEAVEFYKYRQISHGLLCGLSIPYHHPEYRIVFSYGFKKLFTPQQLWSQQHKLIAMGKFCFRKIKETVPMLDRLKPYPSKPHLTLVIDNKEAYETPT